MNKRRELKRNMVEAWRFRNWINYYNQHDMQEEGAWLTVTFGPKEPGAAVAE